MVAFLILISAGTWCFQHLNFNTSSAIGQPLDSLNGVLVYYNGGVDHVSGRNTTEDNYNLGLKYQCVEFVKRYYYEHLHHKMPDSYGHAKDFFDHEINDGEKNTKRDLVQYCNPSKSKPMVDDLLIFEGTAFNRYGHVAIVSAVTDDEIEITQQNPGPYAKPRAIIPLIHLEEKWRIDNDRVLGWLRKE
jgi:surface antigen